MDRSYPVPSLIGTLKQDNYIRYIRIAFMYHVNKDAVCFDHGLFHSEMIWSHYSPSASSLPHGFTASDRGGIFPSFRPTSCSGRAKNAEPEDGIAGREKVPTPMMLGFAIIHQPGCLIRTIGGWLDKIRWFCSVDHVFAAPNSKKSSQNGKLYIAAWCFLFLPGTTVKLDW